MDEYYENLMGAGYLDQQSEQYNRNQGVFVDFLKNRNVNPMDTDGFDFTNFHFENIGKKNTYCSIHLAKVVMDNFESVTHGEVSFTENITGIYGGNASGKSSVIKALFILKDRVANGLALDNRFSQVIKSGAEKAELHYYFDLVTQDGHKQTLVLGLYIEKRRNHFDNFADTNWCAIYRESISIGGDINGKIESIKPVIDVVASADDKYDVKDTFTPRSRQKFFVSTPEQYYRLKWIKGKTLDVPAAYSFLFAMDTLKVFSSQNQLSDYVKAIFEMVNYIKSDLIVFDERYETMSEFMPVYMGKYNGFRVQNEITSYSETTNYNKAGKAISDLFHAIVPTMEMNLDESGKRVYKSGDMVIYEGYISYVMRRMSYALILYYAVYKNPNVTVVIDDMDIGFREDVFGNLLLALGQRGEDAGQLIFTANMLRPLELIDKRSFVFTTLSDDDRYMRFANVARNNNMRNLYLSTEDGRNKDKNKTQLYRPLSEEVIKGIFQ